MSDRYRCCGRKKSWSWNNHAEDCPVGRRASRLAHPAQTAITTNCPAHESEDRYACQACETLSDEWRERPDRRIGDQA